MGEAKRRQELTLKPVSQAVTEAMGWVETAGGKFQVRWNAEAAVAPFGQMAFLIEFLNVTGLLDAWIDDCPLTDLSPNTPTKRDLLGMWRLSIRARHQRYAPVTSIHSDGVNPGWLGMVTVVSEDALRRRRGKREKPHEAQTIAPNTIGIRAMPRIALTNSRTSGARAVSRPRM